MVNNPEAQRAKILVADDDATNRLLLRKTLEKVDCDYYIVEDGFKAVELAKEFKFALIILDILMPKIDGYEAMVKIRQTALNRNTPTFFVTGVEISHELKMKAYEIGAVDFIQKPINIKILRRKSDHFVDFYYQKEKLKLSVLNAELLMRSRMNMTASITHELRTPLFGIQGMLEVLQNSGLTNEQKKLVTNVQSNSEHLVETVNDFLDFSKMDATEIELNEEVFDLKGMCNELIETMGYQKQRSEHVDIFLTYNSKLPKMVLADKSKLRHILLNFLSNAIKFTEKGFVKLRVTKESSRDDKIIVKFVISDTGAGIPEDRLETIFDEYAQADNQSVRSSTGTGLGLMITKKMVDVLGGEIAVRSTVGVGSRFSFSIPCDASTDKLSVRVEAPETLSSILGNKKISILLIDDVIDNIFVLKSFLRSPGVTVDSTVDPREGLEKMKEAQYDIILLDINMPVMTGFEVIKEYRKYEKAKQKSPQYIVSLTAFSLNDEFKEELDEAGFDSYLMKPVEKEKLYSMVKSIATAKHYDFSELEDEFKAYLPKYVENKIIEISDLVAALKRKDLEVGCSICHKILGTAKTFGLFELDRVVESIHQSLRKDENIDYKKLHKLSVSLLQEMEHLKSNLPTLIN